MLISVAFIISQLVLNGVIYGVVISSEWDVLGQYYDSLDAIDLFIPLFPCTIISFLLSIMASILWGNS